MNQATTRAFAFLVLSIAIIIAGYSYQSSREQALANPNTVLETATSSENAMASISEGNTPGTGTMNIVPIANSSTKAPDFTRPLSFKGTFTAIEKEKIQEQYAKVQAVLKSDPKSVNEWAFMGNINHIAGNHALAQEYWEYVSAAWPTNVISFNNLGDLYMNYLRDYPKAEKNWLKAIDNKANDTTPYRNLFTLYTETSYKPTNTAAEDILKSAVAANPRAVDMQYLLATWYKKLGRTTEAQAMFKAAADNATAQGQTQLAAQIKIDAAK